MKVFISPQLLSNVVDQDSVILNMHNGQYYSMSGVAHSAWNGIVNAGEAGITLASLEQMIADEFDVDADTAAQDIKTFVRELVTESLVQVTET